MQSGGNNTTPVTPAGGVVSTLAAGNRGARTAGAPGGPKRLSETEATGWAPNWPMSVEEFLAGDHLDRADVVLTRKHGNFVSWLIRRVTGSQFSHAALVFLVPHREQEFNNTFIIEAATGGVDLDNLATTLKDKASVTAIKRFRSVPPPGVMADVWFTQRIQKLVRGRLLNNIRSKYSYGTIFSIIADLIDQTSYGVSEQTRGAEAALEARKSRGVEPPNSFICSGLVQLGFVEAIRDLILAGDLPPRALKEVVFSPELAADLPDDWSAFSADEVADIVNGFVMSHAAALQAIKPVDLARTPNLEWRYVVREGWVHRVRQHDEVYKLLDWAPEKPRKA